jgi:acyl-coenzyme A thioesterase PaaI-like protein
MCGKDNPLSFGLKFKKNGDGAVSTTFTGDSTLQGHAGIMHGGVLSALLDTAMAQCLLHQDIEAVTGELSVRFLEQVACERTMDIRAWIDSSLPPLYHVKSQIRIGNKIVCKAKARFMQRTPPGDVTVLTTGGMRQKNTGEGNGSDTK